MVKKKRVLNQMSTSPTYLTTLGSRLPDGRCRSSMDGSVWLYRSVPLAPVVDAKDTTAALEAMDPLFRAYHQMADLVAASSTRRFVAQSSYRRTHALLVNIPEHFHVPWSHPLAERLNRAHSDQVVDRRLLLFGVRLRDRVGGGGNWRDQVDSIAAFLSDHQIPMGDFDEDFARVDAALARAGLAVPTDTEFKLADAYWNRGDTPATPLLNHLEHVHVFHTPDSMRLADAVGTDNCEGLEVIPGQGCVSYASVTEFDFDFNRPDEPTAAWVSNLIESDAIAVSIKAAVEPTKITRAELRRQRKRFVDDIAERTKSGKMDRTEQHHMLQELSAVEAHYAKAGANATLVGASVIVAFSGIKNFDSFNTGGQHAVKLAPMTLTQPGAMAETWLCSSIQSNPRLHDIPIQVVAASGMTSLSFVGDREGAMFGLTERDRQIALMSSTAASTSDGLPMFLCVASTGGGKTMVMLNLADQWAAMGQSGVIIDPKRKSDHSAVVESSGGQVVRLDSVREADGIFDPIRFLAGEEALSLAQSALLAVNPWGRDRDNYEQPLMAALKYGVDRGATCTGQALQIAQAEIGHKLPSDLVERVLSQADASPTFSALVGLDPQSRPLSLAKGITLIMVGDSHLNLPLPGAAPDGIEERTALALVRMMVFGSAAALSDRGGGYVALDEAWTFLGAGAGEVQRLGRLARSQQVLPLLFTQRASDALDAGLAGYISRVAIGPLKNDPTEAAAVCKLTNLDPAKYVPRITAPGTIGGDSQTGTRPNWDSMQALKDPETGEVLRGAIYIYKDLDERAVPTEVVLSQEFLERASTNPNDIERREQRRREQEERDRREQGSAA